MQSEKSQRRELYLIIPLTYGEAREAVASFYFKSAYDLAKQMGDLRKPNYSYKIALKYFKLNRKAIIWDRDIYKSVEHAIASKCYVIIEKIKLYT